MKNEYRIVTDSFCGFEVQVRFWWLPLLWFECWNNGPTNSHGSSDDAEAFALKHAAGKIPSEGTHFEKYLGRLPQSAASHADNKEGK